uniref:Uncharacterized protein n=1 Tax=Arundo donax TaxID=35708 RepID=A0A0A9EHN8_ARUDO
MIHTSECDLCIFFLALVHSVQVLAKISNNNNNNKIFQYQIS